MATGLALALNRRAAGRRHGWRRARPSDAARLMVYGLGLATSMALLVIALARLIGGRRRRRDRPAARPAVDRRAFPHRRALGVLPRRRQSRRRGRKPLRHRLRPPRTAPERVLPFYPGVPRRHEPRRARRRRLHLPVSLGVHVAVVVGAGHGPPPRARTTPAPATSISSWRAFGTLCAAARLRPACRAGRAATPSPPSAPTRVSRRSPAASSSALVLLGAGSKAGLVPLHVWLPLAHPAAPSHVSALMSGVMTKVAVYAFIRIVFDLRRHRPTGGGRRRRPGARRRHRGDRRPLCA